MLLIYFLILLLKIIRCDISNVEKMNKNGFKINITIHENLVFGSVNFYQEFVLPPSSTSVVDVNMERLKIADSSGFAVVHIHSYMENITMFWETSSSSRFANATNHGLTMHASGKIYVENPVYYASVSIVVASVVYNSKFPVPGGCSSDISSPTDSATLNIGLEMNSFIAVDACAASSRPDIDPDRQSCPAYNINYEFYYLYLGQGDLTKETYFENVKRMIGVANITAHGNWAGKPSFERSKRSLFLLLPGTGVIFNVIVRDAAGGSATYIPAATYSCHPMWMKNDCSIMDYSIEWVIPAMFLIAIGFIRLFVVFRNNFANLTFNSFFISSYFMFHLVAHLDDVNKGGRLVAVLISGLCLALGSSIFFSKKRLVNKSLDCTNKMIIAWLVAIFVLYNLNDNHFLVNPTAYWLIFATLLTLLFFAMLPFIKVLPQVVHATVGACVILFGIQVLMRSNMVLIIIMHLNHIKHEVYRNVNGVPRSSAEDIFVFVVIQVLLIIGCVFQYKQIIVYGSAADPDALKHPIITRWKSGSDEVFETPQTNSRFFRDLRIKRGYLSLD